MKIATGLLVLLLATPLCAKDLRFAGQDFPPFQQAEGDAIKGGMVEVVKKACEKLKHNCSFKLLTLSRALAMTQEGEMDGVLSMISTPEREVFMNFSPNLLSTFTGYYGLKGKVSPVNSLNDLEGKTVAVVRNSATAKTALENQKKLKNMTVTEEINNDTMVAKLKGERYGDKGMIFGSDMVMRAEAKNAGVELELVLKGNAQEFKLGLSKKTIDAATLADFSRTFESMNTSGETKAIFTKFGM